MAADWIELSSLIFNERVSQLDVVDHLMEDSIYEDQDLCSEWVSEVWSDIERRISWMEPHKPFAIRPKSITRSIEWNLQPAYTFLLLLSVGPKYDGWIDKFGSDYTEQGELFELVSESATRLAFGTWDVMRFGWSPSSENTLEEEVRSLAALLDMESGDVGNWVSDDAKDVGLDLVCHLKQQDRRGRAPTYLIQCASGANYKDKFNTPQSSLWSKLINFDPKPMKAMTVPFYLNDREFRIDTVNLDGYMFDRYRLVTGQAAEDTWLPDPLRIRICDWLDPRIEWLIDG